MNDAQIWTMIGAFSTLMFGMLTGISTLRTGSRVTLSRHRPEDDRASRR
ncbi:hypothetical protein ACYX8G_16350 [Microbacterium saperdae]